MEKSYIERLSSTDVKEIAKICYGKETTGINLSGDYVTVNTDDGNVFEIKNFSTYSMSMGLGMLPKGKDNFEKFMSSKFGEPYIKDLLDLEYDTAEIDSDIKALERKLKELRSEKSEILRSKEIRRSELKMSSGNVREHHCYDKNMKPLGVIMAKDLKSLIKECPDIQYFAIPKEYKTDWFMVTEDAKKGIFINGAVVQCGAIGMDNYKIFMEEQSYKYTGSIQPESYDIPPHFKPGAIFTATDDIGRVYKMQFMGPNIYDNSGVRYIRLKGLDTDTTWNVNSDWFQGKEIETYEHIEAEASEQSNNEPEIGEEE